MGPRIQSSEETLNLSRLRHNGLDLCMPHTMLFSENVNGWKWARVVNRQLGRTIQIRLPRQGPPDPQKMTVVYRK